MGNVTVAARAGGRVTLMRLLFDWDHIKPRLGPYVFAAVLIALSLWPLSHPHSVALLIWHSDGSQARPAALIKH